MVITGLATAVPEHSISQSRAAEISADLLHGQRARVVEALYRRSGVQRRHSVILEEDADGVHAKSFYAKAEDENDRGPSTAVRMNRYQIEAPILAAKASAGALSQAKVSPAAVTHLITVSCSGFSSPGCDLQLVEMLGLSAGVARTNVGFMGCHGLMNALRVGHAFMQSDPAAVVMISATELCSLHQQYTRDPQQIVANALFSDGSACLVLQSQVGPDDSWRLSEQQSHLIPETAEMMTWQIGDHGFEMTLSPSVPDVIRSTLKPWLSAWLGEHGLSIAEIECWAIHPGGPKILSATAEALGLSPAQLAPSLDILAQYGNMSSPTIAFILEQLRADGANPPCVTLAFGPGLTIEAALWR